MNIPVFIVDDRPSRAKLLAEESLNLGYETTWLSPMPVDIGRIKFQYESRLETQQSLLDFLADYKGPQTIWLWDIKLVFATNSDETEAFDTSDYLWHKNDESGERVGAEPILRQPLLNRLNKGDVILLITSTESMNPIVLDLQNDLGENKHNLVGTEDFNSVRDNETARKDWARQILALAKERANGRKILSELWRKNGNEHYFTHGNSIPHEFHNANWEAFWTFIRDWWRLEDVYPLLNAAMRTHFESYFDAAKTLVGGFAQCHVGNGHEPCLSVISLLLLRAAALSNMYTDFSLASLAIQVQPVWKGHSSAENTQDPEMRTVNLSFKLQEKNQVQKWLCILADEVLGILVKQHKGGAPAEIVNCGYKIAHRSFEITFKGEWRALAEGIHSLNSSDGGTLSDGVRKLNNALGDCGPEIGRRQRCVFNAWIAGSQTHFEVRVTP